MKSTKIMLAFIATLLLTWCVMGLIGWMLSDLSYKQCMTNGGTLMLMLIFGWMPSVILACDLDKQFKEY
jgi:hypothetical protein